MREETLTEDGGIRSLEESILHSYFVINSFGVPESSSTKDLAGYAVYLLSNGEAGGSVPIEDAVAYVADSIFASPEPNIKKILGGIISFAVSCPSLLLLELIKGYATGKTCIGAGRTHSIGGLRPGGSNLSEKIARNELYAGGGDNPTTGDKNYEHLPSVTWFDQGYDRI